MQHMCTRTLCDVDELAQFQLLLCADTQKHTCTVSPSHTDTRTNTLARHRSVKCMAREHYCTIWGKNTLTLRLTAYMRGDFGCRATDGEATALVQPALSRSDSRLGCHSTLAVQGPLVPTTLLPLILSLAPGLLTPP